ncbi:MAG TPA: DUF5674 family protein [Bacteroidales bacterium]|nr:DUF5674 family protein [Bacteroidales bacterium]
MKLIDQPTSLLFLWENRETDLTEMMKIVVDVERKIVGLDAELHADIESLMLENGSSQQYLWGANIYPDKKNSDGFLEYTSFINIRPSQNNRSMEVQDIDIQNAIKQIVNELLID